MSSVLDDKTLDQLFREARTHNGFTDKPVSDEMLQAIYDLYKWGPTSANCEPARIVFVRSDEGKKRLLPHLMESNQAKTLEAPVCAIIGFDTKFYENLPRLFPHDLTAKSWFEGEENTGNVTAFRNSTLQGAYFMIAVRAMGLDVGPMSGFDQEAVDKEFFPDGRIKSNFICNIGYGDDSKLFERHPRLDFEEACQLA